MKRPFDPSFLDEVRRTKVSKKSSTPASKSKSPSPASTRQSVTTTPSKSSPGTATKQQASAGRIKRISTSPKRSSRKGTGPLPEDDDDDIPAAKISTAEKAELGISYVVESSEHASQDDPQYAHWNATERGLFNRFVDMGTMPLLPTTWQMDFPTLPDDLFSTNDRETLINSLSHNEFAAMRALSALLNVGTRIRDCLAADLDPAPALTRAIASYERWTLRDGDLLDRHYTDILAVKRAKKHENTDQVVARLRDDFANMSAEYRNGWWGIGLGCRTPRPKSGRLAEVEGEREENVPHAWRRLPTLYGVVIKRTVLAVVSYDAEKDDGEVKNIAIFDFSDPDQDVWNAFAVGILMCQVRDYLVALKPAPVVKRRQLDDDPDL